MSDDYTDFPSLNKFSKVSDIKGLLDWAFNINKERNLDIIKWNNLKDVLVRGRLRNGQRSTPANSSDVDSTDNINDIMWDDSALYILVNNAGTPEWRKAALSSF